MSELFSGQLAVAEGSRVSNAVASYLPRGYFFLHCVLH
jgi:hypothetical protein